MMEEATGMITISLKYLEIFSRKIIITKISSDSDSHPTLPFLTILCM